MAASVSPSEIDSRAAAAAVSLRDVTKVYDNGVMALGPLSLDVAEGEFVSLLGPSGCGKSTALRLIAGLNAPTSGFVGVANHFGRARTGHRIGHSIGFVFQEPTLMPWASVRDNVRLPLKLGHMPDGRSRGAHRRRVGASGAGGIRRCVPARIIRRHEDAGFAGARFGHRSRYPVDG